MSAQISATSLLPQINYCPDFQWPKLTLPVFHMCNGISLCVYSISLHVFFTHHYVREMHPYAANSHHYIHILYLLVLRKSVALNNNFILTDTVWDRNVDWL